MRENPALHSAICIYIAAALLIGGCGQGTSAGAETAAGLEAAADSQKTVPAEATADSETAAGAEMNADAKTTAGADRDSGSAADAPEFTAADSNSASNTDPGTASEKETPDTGVKTTAPADQNSGSAADASEIPASKAVKNTNTDTSSENSYDFTVCFAGDINFDENWATTQHMDECPNGIYDCIDPYLIQTMNEADVMVLNNEFTYSTGGEPLDGKAYTFRADPTRVKNLGILGVDLVTLANNHVYDYGREALLDTFDTLDAAGIPYMGAGHNLEEASSPVYITVQGVKIAFVAASRAEKNKMTPQATESDPGILRCYDTELFDEEIREAAENADYVIAFVHWGTEYSDQMDSIQRDTAAEYIAAGCDAVIGAHTHCLQGMEFIDGKPVVYSLGNYWFNEKSLYSCLAELRFCGTESPSGTVSSEPLKLSIVPAMQENLTTSYISNASEQRKMYDYMEDISVNAVIDDSGNVNESVN